MVEAAKFEILQARAPPGLLLGVSRKKNEHHQKEEVLEGDRGFGPEAITDGLHFDPLEADSPYMREMKRRLWTVIRELDLQSTFEYCLPSLLHNIDPDVAAPANLDDEDFDENSKVLLISNHWIDILAPVTNNTALTAGHYVSKYLDAYLVLECRGRSIMKTFYDTLMS